MKTITLKSGRVATYDDSFKEGDLVIAYWKGVYEFVKYEDRGDEAAPLVYVKQVYRDNGKPMKSKKIKKCDAEYCRKASERITARLSKIEEEKALLSEILKKCK